MSLYRRLHDRFGTVGVVLGGIALILALGGSAFAASGGLTSKQKKEVKKIAKQYAGKDGAAGATGPQGAPGPAGANGKDGANGLDGTDGANGTNGTNGTNGKSVVTTPVAGDPGEFCEGVGGTEFEVEGSGTSEALCNGEKGETGFTETLPAGKTETGSWGAFLNTAGEEGQMIVPLSFNIPLSAPLNETHVVYHVKNYNGEDNTGEEHEICPGKNSNPKAKAGYLCVYTGAPAAGSLTAKGILSNAGTSIASPPGASTTGALLWLETPGFAAAFGSWAVRAACPEAEPNC